METIKEAQKIGKEVREKLGDGWETRIFENIGWHVMWVNGAVSLHYEEHPKVVKRFWVLIGSVGSGTGNPEFAGTCRSFKDPIAAVKHGCSVAMRNFYKNINPIVQSVANVMMTY